VEFEQLIGNASWTILETLADGEKSPAEIAKATGISLASISQQTRLLNAYSLISLQKRPRAGPGKPKQSYNLTKELAYLVVLRKGFAGKKTLKLDDHHKAHLNLCFLDKVEDHYYLEKFLWEREELLQHCDTLAVSDSDGREIHLLIITDEQHLEKLRKEMSTTVIRHVPDKKEERKVICWTHTLQEVRDGLARDDDYFKKLLNHPHAIIDRKNVLSEFI